MTEATDSALPFKPKILIVDDEKRIRDTCSRMLVNEGFEVARAESGESGLEMIQREHFDIVLLDLMMPGMSGMETLVHVRELHPDTVVIVITGYATLDHAVEAMKKGALDFISKPFSPQDLRVMITKATRFIGTLQDIATEKSRMRVLINHLADGVLATDAKRQVVLANPAFLKMVGYQGAGVIGCPVTEWLENGILLEMIDRALAMPSEEVVELSEEIEMVKGPASKKTLHARCIPFRDRMGRNLGAVALLNDITALKEINQVKSDFVSMVAHEIQNPMNTTLTQIKILTDSLAGPLTDNQRHILTRTSQRIKSLSDMAAELLDLAKIESGLITLEKMTFDPADILREQVALHQAQSREKNISLQLDPLPELPLLLANRINIEEVVANLITNAIRYTPEGGRIHVSAKTDNECLFIRVNDTGIGIAPEEIEHIFKRFYRVKNNQTRHIVGTGLGLPIVKSIVEAHNGSIAVTSEPGSGSTFTVRLPILPASE
jgi:two-component system phosphate regulon sensor histidine kinase PhoR